MSASALPGAAAAARFGPRAWGLILVLCGALFLDALDVSMVGVALPSISSDLSMSCLLYTSPSPRDLSTSRMPSSA